MSRFSTSIAVSLPILLLVGISLAQQTSTTAVPNLIRYGGTLKDANGAAIAATTGVTFAIYKQQDGDAPVWMETQNVTPDAGGNYSVLLGSNTTTGLPSDLFSQVEQRWLGVQVQGEAEQPRVLLVSVPYAFKAHEAETLAGKGISDFVLAKDVSGANSAAGMASATGPGSAQKAAGSGNNKSPSNLAASQGPTNFSGSTTDQIVGVTQTGTGAGVNATAPTNAVVGTATAPNGLALYGIANGSNAIAVKGISYSPSGTGVRGTNAAGSGATIGISAYVGSPHGTAAVFNNAAGGKIISGQNNSAEKFSVDGGGNVNAVGMFTGSGAGLTGIQFSQLSGTLASSQFGGTYSNAVTLSNPANLYYGNGRNLTGVIAEPGSPYYIQNGTSQQSSANFNISGNGSANSFSTATTYQIGGSGVLSIGSAADANLFLGVGAGASNFAGQGVDNTFSGSHAGYNNTVGAADIFSGYYAGYNNTSGTYNAFYGWRAGYNNTTGYQNTFSGADAGYRNTTGHDNTFYGQDAGWNTTSGYYNTFSGSGAGNQNTTGNDNTFYGLVAGYSNTTGHDNSFFGYGAGDNNVTGSSNVYIANGGATSGNESNTIRIGQQGLGNLQQNTAYIAGIYGSTSAGGIPVYINSSGQLGTMTSSLRFKEQVRNMGDSTNGLMKLRPVTFFYKPEYDKGPRSLQYGLIAEEVADIYPDLVAFDKDGQPYTVKYQYLAPMLLNEVQRQYHRAEEQNEVIETQQKQIEAQRSQVQAQAQAIESLKHQLQLQNATLQRRLSRLETLVGAQVKIAESAAAQ